MSGNTVEKAIVLEGLRIGQVSDTDAKTGLTVMLFDRSVPAGGHFCGHACSTRQADGLAPDHIVSRVDAFVFTGGSAFGLNCTGGVLDYLEAAGRGLQTPYGNIPICPTAAIFDLALGDPKQRPTAEMARIACERAVSDRFRVGSVGGGTGASVGKLGGIAGAMKGGAGAAHRIDGDLKVQALVICNGFGDVLDPSTGEILAGARVDADSLELLDSAAAIDAGRLPKGFGAFKGGNTVLCAVFSNAGHDKAACNQVSRLAEAGLRKVMRPALAPVDGDVIFTAALGGCSAPVEQVARMAADCIAEAAVCAVTHADGFGLIPSVADRRRFLEEGIPFFKS